MKSAPKVWIPLEGVEGAASGVCTVVCVQNLHPSPLVFVQGFVGESCFLSVHLAQIERAKCERCVQVPERRVNVRCKRSQRL